MNIVFGKEPNYFGCCNLRFYFLFSSRIHSIHPISDFFLPINLIKCIKNFLIHAIKSQEIQQKLGTFFTMKIKIKVVRCDEHNLCKNTIVRAQSNLIEM